LKKKKKIQKGEKKRNKEYTDSQVLSISTFFRPDWCEPHSFGLSLSLFYWIWWLKQLAKLVLHPFFVVSDTPCPLFELYLQLFLFNAHISIFHELHSWSAL
jgi:hypothetical protein